MPCIIISLFVTVAGPTRSRRSKDDPNTIPSSISDAGPLAQDIREEDRKFLDELVRKQNQDGNLLSTPVANTGKFETIESSGKSVPRAELLSIGKSLGAVSWSSIAGQSNVSVRTLLNSNSRLAQANRKSRRD